MIPLGFLASAGASSGGVPAYDLISTVIADGSSATMTLSSIPSTYKHLQIRATFKTNRNSTDDPVNLSINGDTSTSNYTFHSGGMIGNTALTTAYYAPATGGARYIANVAGTNGSVPANIFNSQIIDILDYATSKNKVLRGFSGFGTAVSGVNWIQLYSKLWMNTAVISSISFTAVAGTAFTAGSRISIYGIKG